MTACAVNKKEKACDLKGVENTQWSIQKRMFIVCSFLPCLGMVVYQARGSPHTACTFSLHKDKQHVEGATFLAIACIHFIKEHCVSLKTFPVTHLMLKDDWSQLFGLHWPKGHFL